MSTRLLVKVQPSSAYSKLFVRAMSSSSAAQPRFSSGTDETKAAQDVQELLSTSGGRWTLAGEGQALERSFKFKTFAKTWVSE